MCLQIVEVVGSHQKHMSVIDESIQVAFTWVTTAEKSATKAFNPPPSCIQLKVESKGLAVAEWVGIQSWRKTLTDG